MEVKDWTEAHGVVRLWEALRGSYLGSIRVLQRGFRGALGIKGSRFRIQDSKITHLNPQAYNPRPPALKKPRSLDGRLWGPLCLGFLAGLG